MTGAEGDVVAQRRYTDPTSYGGVFIVKERFEKTEKIKGFKVFSS